MDTLAIIAFCTFMTAVSSMALLLFLVYGEMKWRAQLSKATDCFSDISENTRECRYKLENIERSSREASGAVSKLSLVVDAAKLYDLCGDVHGIRDSLSRKGKPGK